MTKEISTLDACEALARYTETNGSDIFRKDLVSKDGEILCTVWCVLGAAAPSFVQAAEEWLAANNCTED